jgi:magnesium transporter
MSHENSQDTVLSFDELQEAWALLSLEDKVLGFKMLHRAQADDLFLSLSALEQVELLEMLQSSEARSYVRLLQPDDVADLVQSADAGLKEAFLGHLDPVTRKEVSALLAYEEDEAGGLMNPRYARVRPDMSVDEAVAYLRKQANGHPETLYYLYVLDDQQHLLGVVSLRELFAAPAQSLVREAMQKDVVTALEEQDQESVSRLFSEHGLVAIPVVDSEGKMKGIVTVDDIVEVVQEEATEDMQKVGGMEALEAPYWHVGFTEMLRKRAGWLMVLFLGEMLTASAMAYFEHAIAAAVVLALFIPLIISSGGNSGSQACTLVIRAMALGEIRLRDWWRVVGREIGMGAALGCILGFIALLRVWLAPSLGLAGYGPHAHTLAWVVALSLVGVVTFGTFVGSLLPFVLRRVGFDPASASAPFVATLVDVTGLVIYFSLASLMLRGVLL